MKDGPSAWAPAIQVGDPEEATCSWFWPELTLAIEAICGSEPGDGRPMSLSLKLCIKQKQKAQNNNNNKKDGKVQLSSQVYHMKTTEE